MRAYVYPVHTTAIDHTAATSSVWVTIYRATDTQGSLGFEAPSRLDLLAERRATMRHAFTLAWSHDHIDTGLRPSRGVSRRVERPPAATLDNAPDVTTIR